MEIQLESETIRGGIGMTDISNLLESAKLGDRRSLSMLISAISESGDSQISTPRQGGFSESPGLLGPENQLLSVRWSENGHHLVSALPC